MALAAGELVGIAVGEAEKLHQVEKFLDTRPDHFPRWLGTGQLKPERDVLTDRHMSKQRIMLKDESDPATLDRQMRGRLAGQLDFSGVGGLEAGDDPQDRALARTRGTQERDELPLGHLE